MWFDFVKDIFWWNGFLVGFGIIFRYILIGFLYVWIDNRGRDNG